MVTLISQILNKSDYINCDESKLKQKCWFYNESWCYSYIFYYKIKLRNNDSIIFLMLSN